MTHEGPSERIKGAGINPAPIQRPIPVWFGGRTPVAYRRARRNGDGWFPMMAPGPSLRRRSRSSTRPLYVLIIERGDERENLVIVTPGGKHSDLQLWNRVDTAFSELGTTAEWRVENSKPIAITVRYTTYSGTSPASYLVVARISAAETCATDKVPPGPSQNASAGKLAATVSLGRA